ncbi:MAG: flippase-like domain-containing protein [Ignavibacteria bacterium]|nr:flippase-like domain-containing protein [Ignavibacteria bacterium]
MNTEFKLSETSRLKFFTENKTAIIFSLKLIIAGGLLYYLASSIEYAEILSALQNANLYLILAALLLSVLNIYFQFAKWKLTCGQALNETKNLKIFHSLFYGFSAGIITPLRIGEYFGRAIAFKDKSLLRVTAATLIDKFFPLVIVVFLGSILGVMFLYFVFDISTYLALSLFIVLFTLFYLFFLLIMNQRFWDNVFFSSLKNSKRMHKIFEQLKVLKSLDRTYLLKMSLLSLLFYLCFLVQYVLLVSAFSHNHNLLEYFWAGNLIMFAKTVIPPISLGELGIREGASVYFLTQFGETSAVAFNASIFLFIINLLIPAFIGLVLLFKKNDN